MNAPKVKLLRSRAVCDDLTSPLDTLSSSRPPSRSAVAGPRSDTLSPLGFSRAGGGAYSEPLSSSPTTLSVSPTLQVSGTSSALCLNFTGRTKLLDFVYS